MPIIRPVDELCARLSSIGIPERQHNRAALRTFVHLSTGLPPDEHVAADDLARKVLDLHRAGRLVRPTDD